MWPLHDDESLSRSPVYVSVNLRDTCWHAHLSVWTSDTSDHPDLRGRVRYSLPADFHRGQQACAEFLVDFPHQLPLRLDADRLGDRPGMGAAGPAEVWVRVVEASSLTIPS